MSYQKKDCRDPPTNPSLDIKRVIDRNAQPIWMPNDIDALQFFRCVGQAVQARERWQTDRRMDRRYQTYYLPCFAVDNDTNKDFCGLWLIWEDTQVSASMLRMSVICPAVSHTHTWRMIYYRPRSREVVRFVASIHLSVCLAVCPSSPVWTSMLRSFLSNIKMSILIFPWLWLFSPHFLLEHNCI